MYLYKALPIMNQFLKSNVTTKYSLKSVVEVFFSPSNNQAQVHACYDYSNIFLT